ncbi:unnamed protein product [Amoebophrya sp. A25]|nr:unnamed protein product [Amoebophrya sp. A25]|eukprot:GSA25T00025516001.1
MKTMNRKMRRRKLQKERCVQPLPEGTTSTSTTTSFRPPPGLEDHEDLAEKKESKEKEQIDAHQEQAQVAQRHEDCEQPQPQATSTETTTTTTTTTLKSPAPQYANTIYSIYADYDEEGVWVYQSFYSHRKADFAVKNQTLIGCDGFNSTAIRWIMPGFALALRQSEYARKQDQERILKLKISHEALCAMLELCWVGSGGGGSSGHVDWQPESYLWECTADTGKVGRIPRKIKGSSCASTCHKLTRRRSLHLRIAREVSRFYTESILRIEDVTHLAHAVQVAHMHMMVLNREAMSSEESKRSFVLGFLKEHKLEMPNERRYMPPHLSDAELRRLKLIGSEHIERHVDDCALSNSDERNDGGNEPSRQRGRYPHRQKEKNIKKAEINEMGRGAHEYHQHQIWAMHQQAAQQMTAHGV